MFKTKRSFRLTMLGLLFGGLLVTGIGIGVGLAEAAAFSYDGEQLAEGAESRTRVFTLEIGEEGPVYLEGDRSVFRVLWEPEGLETGEDVEPGTAVLTVDYESVGPEPWVWSDSQPDGSAALYFGWEDSGLREFLACKDQVLRDLREKRVGDYRLFRLTSARLRVNPADLDRIHRIRLF